MDLLPLDPALASHQAAIQSVLVTMLSTLPLEEVMVVEDRGSDTISGQLRVQILPTLAAAAGLTTEEAAAALGIDLQAHQHELENLSQYQLEHDGPSLSRPVSPPAVVSHQPVFHSVRPLQRRSLDPLQGQLLSYSVKAITVPSNVRGAIRRMMHHAVPLNNFEAVVRLPEVATWADGAEHHQNRTQSQSNSHGVPDHSDATAYDANSTAVTPHSFPPSPFARLQVLQVRNACR